MGRVGLLGVGARSGAAGRDTIFDLAFLGSGCGNLFASVCLFAEGVGVLETAGVLETVGVLGTTGFLEIAGVLWTAGDGETDASGRPF